ncbi:MAG: hypothetical protein ACP5VF_05985 [Acidobacteriota bacterium]
MSKGTNRRSGPSFGDKLVILREHVQDESVGAGSADTGSARGAAYA